VTKNLAQRIAGKSRGDELAGKDWHRFARECGLGARQVVARVRTLAQSALAESGAAAAQVSGMPAGHHPILEEVQACITRRAQTLLAQLDEAEDHVAAGALALAAAE
jgi:serine/threonine-protein kinase HipA